VKYAQINPLLTLLLALAWVSDRHGKPLVAGGLVGVAAGLKLFPGFLLLYFLGTRQWKALAAAAGTIVGLHVAAVGVFGLGEVVHYFRDVVPQVSEWRSNWLNCSLGGFWSRLFDVTDGNSREWFHSPALAKVLTYATSGGVTAAVGWRTWQARTGEQRDLAFAVTVVAMLLVSPITWDHYLLLLFVPAAILWYYVATTTSWQLLFAAIVFPTGWLPLYLWWGLFFAPSPTPTPSGYVVAAPWQSVAILSPATYSLLALLILGLVWLGRMENASQSSVADRREQTSG
jgi:alpha-1,2-mannosyltransferase